MMARRICRGDLGGRVLAGGRAFWYTDFKKGLNMNIKSRLTVAGMLALVAVSACAADAADATRRNPQIVRRMGDPVNGQ